MPINNKVALVTGGSRGLGRSMALHLARAGADVIITWHTGEERAASVCEEVEAVGRRAAYLRLDTAEIATFSDFRRSLSEVLESTWQRDTFDFLVNNAGINVHASVEQTTEAQFDALLNVHFKGVYFLTQALLPVIADGGRIVCVSTGLTRFTIPGYSAYASMKGAIEVFVKYLAKELGPRGITANAVAPGATATDFNRGASSRNPEWAQRIAGSVALGRVGQPDDIGGLVAFLCSDEGAWVNAQRIEISGGQSI